MPTLAQTIQELQDLEAGGPGSGRHKSFDKMLQEARAKKKFLYHGTTEKNLAGIRKNGFRAPIGRGVHFTNNIGTAHNYAHWQQVNYPRGGRPVVIAVAYDHPALADKQRYDGRYFAVYKRVPASAIKGAVYADKDHYNKGYVKTAKKLIAKGLV